MIRAAAGGQFDPDLVKAWLTIEPKFREIASQCAKVAGGPARSCFHADGQEANRPDDRKSPSPRPANEEVELIAKSSRPLF